MNYKILFLVFTLLFFINNVSATVIFQENFETQTTGNFSILSGTPTFVTTSPYGYYMLNDLTVTLLVTNTTLPDFLNYEYTFLIKIDASNQYNFNVDFYNSTYESYVSFLFENHTGVPTKYWLECYNGTDYCGGLNINTVNLSSYRDINNYVKIMLKSDSTNIYLYINDGLINTYPLDITYTSNFTINEIAINKFKPFAFDEVSINTVFSFSDSIIGHVDFIDTTGSTYDLPNATVRYNSTLFTTTDVNGDFELVGIPYGFLTVSMNAAFDIDSGNKTDFILSYSHPSMTYPTITGNFFYSEYSNSVLPIKYWSNPYFAWGQYNYNSSNTTQACVISTGNTFNCNVLTGNYIFNISFSDIYNYNLDLYHPFLTGRRIFYTQDYNAYNNTQILKDINKPISSLVNKESYLKGVIFNLAFVMFLILCFIYYKGFGEKPKGRRIILWK